MARKKNRLGGSSEPRNPYPTKNKPKPWDRLGGRAARNPLKDKRRKRPAPTGIRSLYTDPDTGRQVLIPDEKAYYLAEMGPEERAEYEAYIARINEEFGKGSRPPKVGKWKPTPDDAGVRRAPRSLGLAKQPGKFVARKRRKGTALYVGEDTEGIEKDRAPLSQATWDAWETVWDLEEELEGLEETEGASPKKIQVLEEKIEKARKVAQEADKKLEDFDANVRQNYGGELTDEELKGTAPRYTPDGREWRWNSKTKTWMGRRRSKLTDKGRDNRAKRIEKRDAARKAKYEAGTGPYYGDFIHVADKPDLTSEGPTLPRDVPHNERLRAFIQGYSGIGTPLERSPEFTGYNKAEWTWGDEGSKMPGYGPGVLITRRGDKETRPKFYPPRPVRIPTPEVDKVFPGRSAPGRPHYDSDYNLDLPSTAPPSSGPPLDYNDPFPSPSYDAPAPPLPGNSVPAPPEWDPNLAMDPRIPNFLANEVSPFDPRRVMPQPLPMPQPMPRRMPQGPLNIPRGAAPWGGYV